MKILLVTFSDNADHQDTVFGLYEQMYGGEHDIYLLAIKTPKVSLSHSDHTWLVDCPKRPGIEKKTFDLPTLFSIVRKVQKGHFDVISSKACTHGICQSCCSLEKHTHIKKSTM